MALTKELTPMLRGAIRRYKVPGASVAILKNNRIMTTAAAGLCSLDTQVPVTDDTLFQIGSITKPFTTTLAMQLVDEGKLDLDTPIQHYLPSFRVADLDVSRTVTARQLLSHQSGIDGDLFVDTGRGDDNTARLLEAATMMPNLFPPGEMLSYCNLGFAIVGRVIEVLTGQTWDEVLKARIFDPLGMKHAFSLPEMALRYRCAIGHVPSQRKKDVWYATRQPYLAMGQKAAGATPTMTASDLLKFAQMHINRGKNQDGDKILNARSVSAMQTRQIRAPKYSPSHICHWGLGWFFVDWDGTRLFGHDGGTIGQAAYLRILPGKDIAVALLTNGGDAAGLADEILGHIFFELSRIRPPAIPDAEPGLQIDVNTLAGTYQNLSERLEFRVKGDDLTLSILPNGGTAGSAPTNLKLALIDRQTARLDTGDPARDRSMFLFSTRQGGKANFVALGLRQYRRVE